MLIISLDWGEGPAAGSGNRDDISQTHTTQFSFLPLDGFHQVFCILTGGGEGGVHTRKYNCASRAIARVLPLST
jgi:hypothetical protein